MDTGMLNELMKRKKETMNKESTSLRESIFRFRVSDDLGSEVFIRVWKDEILSATERDVQESYESLRSACEMIVREEEFNGVKVAMRILEISRVNAVEVYDEENIGTVLYKDWP